MKVFNWVQWKFHHGHSDARKENGVEKNGMRSSKKVVDVDHDEKHVLLDDHVLNNSHHDHQDGLILAIGTLGVGPFVENMQSHFPNHDGHEGNNHGLVDHHDDHIHDDHDDHDDDNLLSNIHAIMFRHDQLEKDHGNGCKEIEEVMNEDELKESNEYRRRVTLADLFSENSDSDSDSDSDHDHDHDDHDYYTVKEVAEKDKDNITIVEKPSCLKTKKTVSRPTKGGFTKAKKLFKDDFRPLNVFNQLMKRMMKKKIHPDMEGKMKKDIQMQPSRSDHQVRPHESASSVLLIQDAMV